MLGVGSNLLVRDGGVPGVVIRLGRHFTSILVRDNNQLDVGAGVLDRNLSFLARDHGLSNLEFLCGIPGTVGGALRMNAGAYGSETKDVLDSALVMDPQGTIHRLTSAQLGFSYRHCSLPDNWIFLGGRFNVVPGDSVAIGKRIEELLKQRDDSQPVRSRTGGSTFANPEGFSAWRLIDDVGGRGLTVGGAQMSEKHCNFMINCGDATATNLETLGEEIRRRVMEAKGIELRWEIIRIGVPLDNTEEQAA